MRHKLARMLDRELKKGSAELLILSLVEQEPRHGYDIARLTEIRSKGVIQFKVASLYPLLYRLRGRGRASGAGSGGAAGWGEGGWRAPGSGGAGTTGSPPRGDRSSTPSATPGGPSPMP